MYTIQKMIQSELDAMVAEALSLGRANMPRICDIDLAVLGLADRYNDDFYGGKAALEAHRRISDHIRSIE